MFQYGFNLLYRSLKGSKLSFESYGVNLGSIRLFFKVFFFGGGGTGEFSIKIISSGTVLLKCFDIFVALPNFPEIHNDPPQKIYILNFV